MDCGPRGTTLAAAFRSATPLPLPRELVEQCVLPEDRFGSVWANGIDSIDVSARRGGLCVQTGAIAESVGTLVLQEAGLDVFSELAQAGVHGVDLLALNPAGEVLAIEVKGTLRATGRPRLRRSRVKQMSLEWLASPANPQMVEWGLVGSDVYGAVMHMNFALMEWKAAVTPGYEQWTPLVSQDELLDLKRFEADHARDASVTARG